MNRYHPKALHSLQKQRRLLFSYIFSQMLLAGCLLVLAVPPALAACPSGMTGYWPLDGETVGIYPDEIGNTGSGKCRDGNCPDSTEYGRVGRAITFEPGKGQGVEIPASAAFNWGAGESFTIEFWVKTFNDGAGDTRAVVGRKDAGSGLLWYVGIRSNNSAAMVLTDANGSGYALFKNGNGPTTIADGHWHHIAAMRDAAANRMALYVDGIEEAVKADAFFTDDFSSATAPMTFGFVDHATNYPFDGSLDEVAVYNRLLTQNEISAHYKNGLAHIRWGYCEAPPFSPIRIMPLGDSITEGVDATVTSEDAQTGYRSHLYRMLRSNGYKVDLVGSKRQGALADPPFDIDNEGHPGFTPQQLLNGIPGWLSLNPPNIILLHVGTDELNATNGPDDIDKILDEIDAFETASGTEITVIVAKIINQNPVSPSVALFNSNLEDIIRQRIVEGDRLIQVDMASALNYDQDMSDKLHPNAAGYTKMADVWLEGLSWSPEAPQNHPPTAKAGEDQNVTEGDTVTLNGTASIDTDGGIVSYLWEQISGEPTVALQGANTPIATFQALALTSALGYIFRLTVTDTGGLTGTDEILVAVNSAIPLKADPVSSPAAIRPGETVTLNGSGSSGNVSRYEWEQVDGPTVILSAPRQAVTTFTAPTMTSGSGTLTFRLTVFADSGASDTSDISVTVLPPLPPEADAGPDQSVKKGALVILDGAGSTGNIVKYAWKQVGDASVILDAPNNRITSFNAPLTGNGDEVVLTFELTVTDAAGDTSTDTVSITVSFVNDPPVADAGEDRTYSGKGIVLLDGSRSTDPDGGIAKYQWVQASGTIQVALTSADTSRARFEIPAVDAFAILVFKLTVTDMGGLSDSDEVIITLRNAQPPVAIAGMDQDVVNGETVTLDGTASFGPEAGITGYKWVQTSGASVTIDSPNSMKPTFVPPPVREGEGPLELIFQLTVTDANNLTATDTVSVFVSYANLPPAADAGQDITAREGKTVHLDGSGSKDPLGDELSFQWAQLEGPSASISGSNQRNATITAPVLSDNMPATLLFQLTVSDGVHSDTDTVSITITASPPNADAGNDQTVLNGVSVTLNGTGSSAFSGTIDEYQWKQVAGPSVSILAPGSATTSLVAPEVGPAGASLMFELTVTDDRGLTDTDTVIVNVTYSNNPPVAYAGENRTVTEGSLVVLDGNGSTDNDDAIAAYLWQQISGEPVVLTNAETSIAGFTAPMISGSTDITFRLQVTDARGLNDTDEVTITVTVAPGPTANAGSDQSTQSGEPVTLDGDASFAAVGTLVAYKWEQTGGPDITLVNAETPTPSFNVPVIPESGATFTFKLTVTDSRGFEDADTVSVFAAFANIAPIADAGPDRAIVEGTEVGLDGSNSVDVDGGIVAYQWRQIAGTPVTLIGENSVKALFTAPPVSVNGLIFELTVTDGGGLSDTDRVTLPVNVATPPVADAGEDQVAANGEAVTLNGSASFGSSSDIITYQWEQIGGETVTLASGNTAVTGFTTPTLGRDNLNLTFRLTVTDANDFQSTDTVNIFVNFDNMPPVANAGQDQQVIEGATVLLDGSGSYDPDGGIASYQWVQLTGEPVLLADATAVKTTFVAPAVGKEGLLFQLLVSDKTDLKRTDDVLILVNDNGVAPFDDSIVSFVTATGRTAGLKVAPGGGLTMVSPLDSSSISTTPNRPINFLYGIIQTEIKIDAPGDAAVMTLFLSEPAPPDYELWQYSVSKGWKKFGDRAVFNETRDQITVSLDDGGEGDEATLSSVDGVIRTLTALAKEPEEIKDDKDELISCFISGISR